MEGGSGWRIHVNPWLIHVNVWQTPLQYCKVISLQLIKKKKKKKQTREGIKLGRRGRKCWETSSRYLVKGGKKQSEGYFHLKAAVIGKCKSGLKEVFVQGHAFIFHSGNVTESPPSALC